MKIYIEQSDLRRDERSFIIKDILWGLVIIANLAFTLSVVLHSL